MKRIKYDLIYTDPAWSYNKKVGQGIADDQYPTMSLEDIKALPVYDLLMPNGLVLEFLLFNLC